MVDAPASPRVSAYYWAPISEFLTTDPILVTGTRSSYYLEDAATEFHIQGLELDWTCVTWDADLRMGSGCWEYHSFRGKRWQRINRGELQKYLLNAYRVLLTRARQGMVIFVPDGDDTDPTRKARFYDETHDYLSGDRKSVV